VWNALVFEVVMTFGLVYIIYTTTVNPKKGNVGIVAPIPIGLIVGANILVLYFSIVGIRICVSLVL